VRPALLPLLRKAAQPFDEFSRWPEGNVAAMMEFLAERYQYVLEQRGYDIRNVRAVTRSLDDSPVDARRKLEALPEFTTSIDFRKLAVAFKRVKNIARELDAAVVETAEPPLATLLKEPAEIALLQELDARGPVIDSVLKSGENLRRAFVEAAQFGPAVDRLFTEIFVMVDDPALRKARLRLMRRLEQQILRIADISEIVSETE
jgi:glycyl-tRNA synthetase beta chain